MFKVFCVAIYFTVLLVTGCVTAPQPLIHSQQLTPNLKPAPGKSSLIVIRKTMFKGSAGTWSVSLDGRELSRLSISSYITKEIEPGEHYLSNVILSDTPTIVQAKEGNIYFFNYDLPFFGGNAFEELLENEALELIGQYTRVKTFF